MSIFFFDPLQPDEQEFVRGQLKGHSVQFIHETIQSYVSVSRSDIEIAAIFVPSKVTASVIDQLPNLKYITTRSTGYDHIDLSAAQNNGIVVSNVPFYGSNTVAEHTFALLLALTRKVPQSIDRVRGGSFTYEGLQGVDLMGKTMGIIGGGHIGIHVAKIANGFGMRVLVYDAKPNLALSHEHNFEYITELSALLTQSDVISLHVPLNEHTHHIINESVIQYIKNGAYFINTARGGLVETGALMKMLHAGKLAGVGLDVLEGEEFLHDELQFLAEKHTDEEMHSVLEDHVLIEMENVIVTPHNAFNTKEAHFRNLQTTVENIQKFINGEVQNVVEK